MLLAEQDAVTSMVEDTIAMMAISDVDIEEIAAMYQVTPMSLYVAVSDYESLSIVH